MHPTSAEQALLAWYVAIGADEAIESEPRDRLLAPPPKPAALRPAALAAPAVRVAPAAPATPPPDAAGAEGVAQARQAAQGASSLAELEAAVRAFTGCALKAMASRTVFADGNPAADL